MLNSKHRAQILHCDTDYESIRKGEGILRIRMKNPLHGPKDHHQLVSYLIYL